MQVPAPSTRAIVQTVLSEIPDLENARCELEPKYRGKFVATRDGKLVCVTFSVHMMIFNQWNESMISNYIIGALYQG
jgi:hypothetical protein